VVVVAVTAALRALRGEGESAGEGAWAEVLMRQEP